MKQETGTIHIDTYFTCLEHMKRKFERDGRKYPVKTDSRESYLQWKQEIRQKLWELLGLSEMETCPLDSRTEEIVLLENGILREKVRIQVEPGVWMTMYILIPENARNRKDGGNCKNTGNQEKDQRPSCVIAPPGHQGAGKYSVAGCRDIPAVKKMIDHYHYDYGMQLAKRGLVVLCPDCRGFGERREQALWGDEEQVFLNSSCFHLAHMAEPLGMTVAGMLTWDLMRLVDYIEKRDEWDLENIGCVGFSGGGMQTLWLAAMDERIARACISGYMYGYQESLLELNGNCSCNYVPGLWKLVDMGDVGAMIAPRPLIIQSCREDHLNGKRGIANAVRQVEIIRLAYQCLDAGDHLYHQICEGGHQWHEEAADLFADSLNDTSLRKPFTPNII